MRRLIILAAGVGLWALSALAFANVPIGAVVENVSLPALAGGEQNFLSDTNISVFIFFKPGQEHSNQARASVPLLGVLFVILAHFKQAPAGRLL